MTTDHDDEHWRWATPAPGPARPAPVAPLSGAVAAAGPGTPRGAAVPAGPLGPALAHAAAAPVLSAPARWRSALADRLPPTLQGRWGLDRATGLVLAVSILLSALLLGGWAVLRSRPHALAVARVHASDGAAAGAGQGTPIGAADAQPVPVPPPGGPAADGGGGGDGAGAGGAGGAGAIASAAPGTVVIVDVEGRVARPGVRTLAAGSRVIDAVAAAGGALPGTDLSMLNQARVLTDGEQVLVGVTPPPGAEVPSPGRGGKGRGKSRAQVGEIEPVRLNSAAVEDLEQLPGIGPALAQRVVDYRTEHGPFHSVDELRQVSGFGGQRFATLAPLLSL
jgi:competence protein ComEA